MSSLNQNYASAIRGFQAPAAAPQCFQAASAGQFNQLASGRLAAYALFWISGDVQQLEASFATRQFIWGNLDDDNTNGWGIYLEPDALTGQMVLTAGLYAASGLRTSSLVLSNPELPSFVERLICAALWYDGGNLTLSVNGSLQPSDVHADEAYSPSALPASLGGDAAGEAPATNVCIVSAGYAPLNVSASAVGAYAGLTFRNCREADGGGYIAQLAVDWAHRYEASAAMLAGTPGTITKTALGPSGATAPIAPTTLADLGNAGPTPFAGVSPAPLSRLGVLDLQLDQVAQPDWYMGAAFEFAAPVPA